MPTIREMYDCPAPKQYKVQAGLPNDTGVIIASENLVGIEVEVENVTQVNMIGPMWSTEQDGSLRNNGVEFISRPIAAKDAPASLQHLMSQTLTMEKCFSPRTSVHVHMDFSNNTAETVVDVLLMYSVFERLLYRFVGRQRIKNIYCVPVTETSYLRAIGTKGLRPNDWAKYTGLNLRPLASYGTMEFRHMHGTPDARKISLWIDIITRLKTYCLTQGTKNIRKMIASMDDSFDFRRLLIDVFGERADLLGYTCLDDVRFTYLTAKLGLSRNNFINAILTSIAGDAPFFKVKAY